MRNLKRALSLALATVMTLGMMVVGTGASYKDVTSKDNQEAIDVMKAVGVMIGDDKGNFNPEKNVTRAEMAVVMSNLLDLDVDDFKAAKLPFTDVPAWAAPYVAACYADGITSGTSATTYGSNESVTAAQAALMMMKALGYFQTSGDFGNDWQLATVKQASKIDLFAGINVSATGAMTRNDVAQIALNTLESTMVVNDNNGSNITIGDITISNGSKYVEVEKSGKAYYAIKGDKANEKNTVELGEQLYAGDLKKTAGNDDMGRPGTAWDFDGDEVGVYGSEADYVVVLEKQYDAEDVLDPEEILRDLTDNDDLVLNTKDTNIFVNGSDAMDGDENAIAKACTYGTVLELFCDGDVVTDVVALDYDLAKIEDISTKLTKAQKEDGATCKVKVDGVWYLDIDFADFDEDEYTEDAYILYVADADSKDNVILASELAETVEGKVSYKKGDDVKIDGEWYGVAEATVKVRDEGTFYLNKAGQITLADTEKAQSDDYAYIYNTKTLDGETNDDGFETDDGLKVYVVLADGTKASYVVEEDSVEAAKAAKGTVVAYSLNKDDEFEIENEKDDIAMVENADVDKGDAKIAKDLYATGKTEFIFVNVDGSKVKTSTATSYKNVKIADETIWTVADGEDVLYAFVLAADEGVTTDAELAVVLDDQASEGVNEDDDPIYTYTVAVDGVETELTFEDEQDFELGQVISFTEDGDYATVEDTLDVVTVDAANDEYVVIGDKQYNLGEETVYTITMEYDDEADYEAGIVDSVYVNEGGKIESDSKIIYTLDDGELDVVFVIEANY